MSARRREAFYQQLERLLDAGTDLRGALEMLARHQESTQAPVARAALASLQRGGALADGLKDGGLEVPGLHRRLLEIGEQAGEVGRVLRDLRAWDAERRKLRRDLMMPLAYPAILLVSAVLIGPLPKLVSGGTEAYLPSVLGPMLAVLGVPALALLAWRLWPAATGRALDTLPLVSRLRREMDGSIFLYCLGTGLEVGLELPEALGRAAIGTDRPELRALGDRLQAQAREGRFRVEALAEAKCFGQFAGQVLAAAAEAGTLGTAALSTSRLLREEGLATAKRGITVASALLYVGAAVVVGWTVIGFYMRLYSATGL